MNLDQIIAEHLTGICSCSNTQECLDKIKLSIQGWAFEMVGEDASIDIANDEFDISYNQILARNNILKAQIRGRIKDSLK